MSQSQTNRISLFIKSMFKEFSNDSIRYCVLRWSEDGWKDGGDVDVLLAPVSVKKAISIVVYLASIQDAAILLKASDGNDHHVLISFPDINCSQTQALDIHFQSAISEAGRIFLSSYEVLEFIEVKGAISRPKPPMEAAIILIHSIVGKQYFKPHYWLFVREIFKEHQEELIVLLALVFGSNIAQKLCERTTDEDQKSVLLLRKEFLLARKVKGFNATREVLKSLYRRISRRVAWYINPPGKLIIIEGESSDQNSSIGKSLLCALKGAPYKSEYINFHKSKITSIINNNENQCDILIASPVLKNGMWQNYFCLIKYCWIYFQKIRPILAKNGVVIANQYYFSPITSLHESYLERASSWIKGNIIVPDLIVCLSKFMVNSEAPELKESNYEKFRSFNSKRDSSTNTILFSTDSVENNIVLSILREIPDR
ncbi:MAG: hypothetical protein QM504_06075 [Pseudomonadota bacterium]